MKWKIWLSLVFEEIAYWLDEFLFFFIRLLPQSAFFKCLNILRFLYSHFPFKIYRELIVKATKRRLNKEFKGIFAGENK